MSRLSFAAASHVSEPPPADALAAGRLAGLLLEVARSVNRDVAAAVPSHLDGDPRLDALRSVLLEHDRAAFTTLRTKIDDPEQFAEAVSAVLAHALALAEARDERLAAVLAPAMERAAHGALRKDAGPLVGILYPLVGPVIRKSIAESLDGTLRRLNSAFTHSLSWRGLKWRLEAYRSGSSYADIVLKHTVVFRVEHLFLIHRETGLLLEHVAASQAETQDPHMVSGMLTAIQDFVRDSFGNAAGGGGAGLDSLRLGDLLIWCEAGPHALLAAVIQGNPPETLHAVLREALAGIHQDLREPLETFDGDSARLGNLVVRLEPCLQQQEQALDTRLSPWLWALPLLLLAIGGAWLAQRVVERSRVDSYVQALRGEPGMVVAGVERRGGAWHVSGLRDPLAADPAVLLEQSRLDPERVVENWEPYEALHPAIVLKRLEASLEPPPGVSLSLSDGTIRAGGSAPDHWVEKARTLIASLPAGAPPVDLTGIQDIQDPTFIRLRDAIQAHLVTFASGAPRPPVGQDHVLDALASEFIELLQVARGLGFSVRVMIVGHADATGQETANLALSAARAEVVRSMLRARGIAPHLLLVRSAGTLEPLEPEAADAPEPSLAANRRVTFTVSTSD